MNAVVQLNDAPPARAPSGGLAQRLTDIHNLYLARFEDAKWLHTQSWTGGGIYDRQWIAGLSWGLHGPDPVAVDNVRRQVVAKLDEFPSTKTLADMRRALTEALEAPPHPKQAEILIVLMVDAFPNAKPGNGQVYVETLIAKAVATGHSPAIVAGAADAIITTNTFLPVPAEFLKACDDKARALRCGILAIDHAEQRRRTLQDALTGVVQ